MTSAILRKVSKGKPVLIMISNEDGQVFGRWDIADVGDITRLNLTLSDIATRLTDIVASNAPHSCSQCGDYHTPGA